MADGEWVQVELFNLSCCSTVPALPSSGNWKLPVIPCTNLNVVEASVVGGVS